MKFMSIRVGIVGFAFAGLLGLPASAQVFPATDDSATSAPATGAPATGAPATGAPATGAPATGVTPVDPGIVTPTDPGIVTPTPRMNFDLGNYVLHAIRESALPDTL